MALSPAPAVRALPGSHLSSSGEGAWISGARNRGLSQKLCRFCLSQKLCHFCLSQKLCCFCSPHSHLSRLVSEGPGAQDGSLTCSGSQSPLPCLLNGWDCLLQNCEPG